MVIQYYNRWLNLLEENIFVIATCSLTSVVRETSTESDAMAGWQRVAADPKIVSCSSAPGTKEVGAHPYWLTSWFSCFSQWGVCFWRCGIAAAAPGTEQPFGFHVWEGWAPRILVLSHSPSLQLIFWTSLNMTQLFVSEVQRKTKLKTIMNFLCK